MSGRRGRPGRNNNSESKYPDEYENALEEHLRKGREEAEAERQYMIRRYGYDPNANDGYNNNGYDGYNNRRNNNNRPNNWDPDWNPNNYAGAYEEVLREEEQQEARNRARNENVEKGLNRLPSVLSKLVREFEGPVEERRVNVFNNFPGSPYEKNAFLPVPRNRQVNPELPGNPWEANALPGRRRFFEAAPRPIATGRWKRKNRKTRRSRKNRKLRRSQRKNRK